MPATPQPLSLAQLQANAAVADAAVTAALQRIADAQTLVRDAAHAYYTAVLVSIEPHPAVATTVAKTKNTAALSIDELARRLNKALTDYQAVCRDLGV